MVFHVPLSARHNYSGNIPKGLRLVFLTLLTNFSHERGREMMTSSFLNYQRRGGMFAGQWFSLTWKGLYKEVKGHLVTYLWRPLWFCPFSTWVMCGLSQYCYVFFHPDDSTFVAMALEVFKNGCIVYSIFSGLQVFGHWHNLCFWTAAHCIWNKMDSLKLTERSEMPKEQLLPTVEWHLFTKHNKLHIGWA